MDYRRNEDKLGCRSTIAQFNRLISLVATESTPTEPVTLDEVKDHLRVTFNDDDAYLTMLIKAARNAIERYTNLSLVTKTITAEIDNYEGSFELPYGPVVGSPVVKDSEANTLEATFGVGTVKTPASGGLTVTYTAGFTSVPVDLKLAIMHEVAYQYEHRGDEADKEGLSPIAKGYAKMHRRVPRVF